MDAASVVVYEVVNWAVVRVLVACATVAVTWLPAATTPLSAACVVPSTLLVVAPVSDAKLVRSTAARDVVLTVDAARVEAAVVEATEVVVGCVVRPASAAYEAPTVAAVVVVLCPPTDAAATALVVVRTVADAMDVLDAAVVAVAKRVASTVAAEVLAVVAAAVLVCVGTPVVACAVVVA